MVRHPFGRATAIAGALQLGVVGLGLAVPAWQRADLSPIFATLLAVLAGFLLARWLPAAQLPAALLGGSLAGLVSSFAGALLAALLGLADPSPVVMVLIASATGAVSGAVGGLFGTLFRAGPTG